MNPAKDESSNLNLIQPIRTADTVLTKQLEITNSSSPFVTAGGEILNQVIVSYETYGTLSPEKDNAILVFHALSGTPHAAGLNTTGPSGCDLWNEECYVGWWDDFIGAGKGLDTNKNFVICANYLGSCYGSTGPRSINPNSKQPYGSNFPRITTADVVRSQAALLDKLGITKLKAAVGGSLGGVLVLSFATLFPERVAKVVPICTGHRVTTLQALHNLEQIMAIENDPAFNGGDYELNNPPTKGLALARIIGHKTFVSLDTMSKRAREDIADRTGLLQSYQLTSSVESYMLHQGLKFTARFDANSYLRIMEIWQNIDLCRDAKVNSLKELYIKCRNQEFLIFSVDSDVCFYPEEQIELATSLREAGVKCSHITVHSDKGHDAFLLEPDLFNPYLAHFLNS